MAQWYCFLNGEVRGPLSDEELIALPDIVPSVKVCEVGCGEWEALADMDGLYKMYKAAKGTTKTRKVAIECAYHANVPAVVECRFCNKNLCEDCANQEDDRIICRDCMVKRAGILKERAAEKARKEEAKRIEVEKELAAMRRKTIIKRVTIAVIIIVVLVVGAIATKKIIDFKNKAEADMTELGPE